MPRALTIDDLFGIERPVELVLSRDGECAWLLIRRVDLAENASSTRVVRIDVCTGAVVPIDVCGGRVKHLSLSPDGGRIYFVARDEQDCEQVWVADADGGHARCLSHGYGGASRPVPSADGRKILFSRQVYRSAAVQETFARTGIVPTPAQIYGLSHDKANARIADALLFRHWDAWTEERRNHLFVLDVESGEFTDITPQDVDTPPIALESSCDYAFSPDGRRVAYVQNADAAISNTRAARSTNNSVYLYDLESASARRISDTDGCDTAPRFLDDSHLAYLSMLTPGYEADAVRLKIYDIETGTTRVLLPDFDRSIDEFIPCDGDFVLLRCQDFAHFALYRLNWRTGDLVQLTSGHCDTHVAVSRDMSRILVLSESLCAPSDVYVLSDLMPFSVRLNEETISSETRRPLTHFGDAVRDVEMHPGARLCTVVDGTSVEGYVVTPPGFDPDKRYPLILLIHGGPQGAFLDQFHYRWNAQMFAAQGAMVAFCNPQGSTGYGHALTRSISRHWSDACPEAILAFLDHVLAVYPQADPARLAAAGASFGGYMINWLLGHTDRFKAFVSHDGIFHTEMMAYETDELWFDEFEFGGAPYECPGEFLRHSPHVNVANFKTPTLVVQGEQDFRCCASQGIALFTALQMMGVESRLLYFPNEGHWVLDPADSAVWYDQVVGWLMCHV